MISRFSLCGRLELVLVFSNHQYKYHHPGDFSTIKLITSKDVRQITEALSLDSIRFGHIQSRPHLTRSTHTPDFRSSQLVLLSLNLSNVFLSTPTS